MAQIHNELRRAGALGRALKNFLGISDPDASLERLGETLVPILDLWQIPEAFLLRGERLVIGVNVNPVLAGGAGLRSQLSFSNPTGSGEIAVIEQIIISAGANRDLLIAWSDTELNTALGNVFTRDTRKVVSPLTTRPTQCQVFSQNNAALANATSIQRVHALANTDVQALGGPLVLSPGFSVRVMPVNDNSDLDPTCFVARTRQAFPSELV